MKKLNFLKAKVPMIVYIIVFILIIVAGILNVFLNKPSRFEENKDSAITACIKECNISIVKGISLIEGPCLSEEIVPGWVCDVVNVPRVSLIDNNPNNQCTNYIKNKLHHFIEVNQNCGFVNAK